MKKETIYEIIKIVTTAILAIASTLLITSCIMVKQQSKNTKENSQNLKFHQETKMDSINNQIKIQPK